MSRWLQTLFWRLTHPFQARCAKCAFWKRRWKDKGSCWQAKIERVTYPHRSCLFFLKRTIS